MQPSKINWIRILLTTLVLAASSAGAHLVAPPVSLEELASTADLVCKATVISDRHLADDPSGPIPGVEAREAELRVVSIVKGHASNVIRFRHYEPSSPLTMYELPRGYTMATGRTYLVFAAQTASGTYRQLSKTRGLETNDSVFLAANAKPHLGTTATEAVWSELLALIKSPVDDDAIDAIHQLDSLSGGPAWERNAARDFDRSPTLVAIAPLVGAKSVPIATAAITVLGRDSPYFDDQDAPFWFVGFGKSANILSLGGRKRPTGPLAVVGTKELLEVATHGMAPELRVLAIRALGRNSDPLPATMVASWLRDPNTTVRQAAVLASADLPGHVPIIETASTDHSPDIRRTAGLAVGFAQDERLLPLLDKLLHDPVADVRSDAAMSLISFAPDQAAPVLKANLTTEFRPLFINALASADPEPYLPMLAEVIERAQNKTLADQMESTNWNYGVNQASESWRILLDFVKSRPATELTAGKFDSSLNALEQLNWGSSGEPTELYALYLTRGLVSRAKAFRDAARKSIPYDMDIYFDRVDQNPSAYVP